MAMAFNSRRLVSWLKRSCMDSTLYQCLLRKPESFVCLFVCSLFHSYHPTPPYLPAKCPLFTSAPFMHYLVLLPFTLCRPFTLTHLIILSFRLRLRFIPQILTPHLIPTRPLNNPLPLDLRHRLCTIDFHPPSLWFNTHPRQLFLGELFFAYDSRNHPPPHPRHFITTPNLILHRIRPRPYNLHFPFPNALLTPLCAARAGYCCLCRGG
ncbi:hypothetical protein BKA61DRAFT_601577 [Leptodontidium sp. MPI-SDFR-AT-0119]|nr:hypothetical protein BKA61DRAFT_601577 [Leptodontidium sp. MPI-SDFR-AT-0119]